MHTLPRQFALFLVNGGLIGILCWALQWSFYAALGHSGALAYWCASLGSAAIGIAINYQMQRRFIFSRAGNFWHFAGAASAVSFAVSFAAVAAQAWLARFFDAATAARFGFVVGALAVAPLSFVIKKFLIFRG